MNAYQQLRQQARAQRDSDILKARDNYRQSINEIDTLERKITGKRPQRSADSRVLSCKGKPFSEVTVTKAAELILSEGKPLMLVELVLEIQRRGCHAGDDPRKLVHCLQSAFYYHRNRFRTDEDGRWWVLG